MNKIVKNNLLKMLSLTLKTVLKFNEMSVGIVTNIAIDN